MKRVTAYPAAVVAAVLNVESDDGDGDENKNDDGGCNLRELFFQMEWSTDR